MKAWSLGLGVRTVFDTTWRVAWEINYISPKIQHKSQHYSSTLLWHIEQGHAEHRFLFKKRKKKKKPQLSGVGHVHIKLETMGFLPSVLVQSRNGEERNVNINIPVCVVASVA
jgi:hypothetical protein